MIDFEVKQLIELCKSDDDIFVEKAKNFFLNHGDILIKAIIDSENTRMYPSDLTVMADVGFPKTAARIKAALNSKNITLIDS